MESPENQPGDPKIFGAGRQAGRFSALFSLECGADTYA